MSKRLKVLGLVGVLLASLALPVEAKTGTVNDGHCTTRYEMWENGSYIFGSTTTGPVDPCVSVAVMVRVLRYTVFTNYWGGYNPVASYRRVTSDDQLLVYSEHHYYWHAYDWNYHASYRIYP